MITYIKVMLALQALSLLWVGYIALTEGDPGTALGWVFFQFAIAPFVLIAIVLGAMRFLMELALPRALGSRGVSPLRSSERGRG